MANLFGSLSTLPTEPHLPYQPSLLLGQLACFPEGSSLRLILVSGLVGFVLRHKQQDMLISLNQRCPLAVGTLPWLTNPCHACAAPLVWALLVNP